MFTQQTCSQPSGSTPMPPAMLSAAVQAGVNAAAQSLPVGQIAQSVAHAVRGAAVALQRRGLNIDPNSAMLCCKAGMNAAREAKFQINLMCANRNWYRLLQRQPEDFAGVNINPQAIAKASQMNVAATIVDPIKRAAAQAAATSHAPAVCNPTFDDAPDVMPINGDFVYTPATAKLTGRM